MKFWMYYLIGAVLLLHPHLNQKIGMLWDYLSHPDYQFWTTFSSMDLFDLMLHAGLPVVLIALGIKKQREKKDV